MLAGFLQFTLCGTPASDSLAAMSVWSIGFLACALAALTTRPRSFARLAAPLAIGVLLALMIGGTAVQYPASMAREREMQQRWDAEAAAEGGLKVPSGCR
jgi:hypothetical protein